MKPEPLKNKVCYAGELYITYLDENLLDEPVFLKEDVKSAVEWLLEKIDEKIAEHKNSDSIYKEGIVEGLARAKQYVKEAFEDVVNTND